MTQKKKRWKNWEDRMVIDACNEGMPGIAGVANILGRTYGAVAARRTKLKTLPCPFWVIDPKSGDKWFCEQGDGGHWGTCCGGRTEDEYVALGGADGWERS